MTINTVQKTPIMQRSDDNMVEIHEHVPTLLAYKDTTFAVQICNQLASSPVTDEDHVCQTCEGRGPGGQNRNIHLTFSGLRLQRGYKRYVTITKPRCTQQLIIHIEE